MIRKIDWETIEKLYRLGQFSIRTIAKEHQIAASTLSRRARKENWIQDKREEVAERTRAALIAQHERVTPTQEDIEVAVQTNIAIVRSHRRALDFQRRIDAQLAEALDKNQPKKVVTKDGQIVFVPMSLLERSAILRSLAQAAKAYIPLERQAHLLQWKK